MSKQRLSAIEYIRGISMLSVVAIHVGGEYFSSNPTPNMHLVALLEVATRFSIPIFFFVSAFGLFYNFSFDTPFCYKSFLQRRLKAVLIPYIVWTLFYIIFNQYVFHVGWPNLRWLCEMLFYGTAKYQLYFMVILLWFYIFMPLWVRMLKNMTMSKLGLILIFQVLFNYWSTNLLQHTSFTNPLIQQLIFWRLNYWPLHYLFIFLLGGYLALHSKWFMQIMKERRQLISFFFKLSLCSLIAWYYRLILIDHYSIVSAVNTAQQLSTLGICYSFASAVFFFTIFTYQEYPAKFNKWLALFGKHSYFVYLFHPVILTFTIKILNRCNLIITAPVAILIYIATVTLSLGTAILARKIGSRFPVINRLTIGSDK